MKNLTFTLFFLSFFLSGNAQEQRAILKTTDEGHLLIQNSSFYGSSYFRDGTYIRSCSNYFLTAQYNGNFDDKDFVVDIPLYNTNASNIIANDTGSSKIAISNHGRIYFPSGIMSNAHLYICEYSHRDGSIIPMLIPQNTNSAPYYSSIHLIDFPNGDWGIVGRYRNGDFSFSGMNTPFVENNGQFKNFILRFNGTTNQVIWQQEIAVETELISYVSSNGDLYLFGEKASNTVIHLDNLTLNADVSNTISTDYYIAKIDAQGTPILLKSILKTANPIIPEFHLRDSMYFLVGKIDSTAIFNLNTTLNGNYSFIAKYATNNDSLVWLKKALISIENSVLDLQNNIYFTGTSPNINWTLDSTHFYNETKFFGKMNEIGMTTAVTFDTLSNLNIFNLNQSMKQLAVTSENRVYMLVGDMEYADKLVLIEINPICQIGIVDTISYYTCYISTKEESLESTIQIAPNPTTDFINISIKDENDLNDVFYRLYNSNGQLLKEGNINNQTESIDIQSLPSGLYFTEIITEKGSVTKKVVKL